MEALEKPQTFTTEKYAASSLQWSFDWTELGELAGSSWEVPAPLVKVADEFTDTTATIQIAGGDPDTRYVLVNTVTTVEGLTDQRYLSLYIKKSQPYNPLVLTTLPKYTSYDQVRALLSITDEELEDITLAQPNFEIELFEQLREVAEPLQQLYLDTLLVSSPSAAQSRFIRLVKSFSGYAVAVQLLNALPLLAVASDADARAKYERFEKPFERVEAAIRAAFQVATNRLIDAYNSVAPTPINVPTSMYPITSAVGLATDPVTG